MCVERGDERGKEGREVLVPKGRKESEGARKSLDEKLTVHTPPPPPPLAGPGSYEMGHSESPVSPEGDLPARVSR